MNQLKFPIKLIRKIKSNLIRFRFHYIFEPFSKVLLTVVYLSRLSKWAKKNQMPVFNDFYSKKHDYNKRYQLYEDVIKSEKLSKICYMEFGVAQGQSFKWWIRKIKDKESLFFGFDTFEGLPEEWGHFKKGEMSVKGSFPDIKDGRCRFIKGVFQETLPSFLRTFKCDLRKIIHLDADLYTSTLFALTMMGPYLNIDDILIFDEFNVPLHEFKAFSEFISSYQVRVEAIAAVNNYYQTAFIILDNKSLQKKK